MGFYKPTFTSLGGTTCFWHSAPRAFNRFTSQQIPLSSVQNPSFEKTNPGWLRTDLPSWFMIIPNRFDRFEPPTSLNQPTRVLQALLNRVPLYIIQVVW